MYIKGVIFLFVALLFVSCNQTAKDAETNATIPPQQVNVHTLKKERYPVWISFSGKTQAYESVDVISRVQGELLAFDFLEGHKVKKGDLLYQIDKSPYQAQYNQQLALLQKDKATLALAQATIDRYKPLVAEQLAPREKLDQLQANLKELKAIVQSDEAKLNELRLNLHYCDITATIDGYIGKSNLLVGNLVNVGDKLTTITNSDKLYVYFTNPVSTSITGTAPYNPFLIVDKTRGKEVHLSGNIPTDLADMALFGTWADDSDPATGKYYQTVNNLPWALDLPVSFDYPVEQVEIIHAYNHFVEWAESGGSSYPDWYEDNAGYRNSTNIYTPAP
jgi:biotin carboxyl carrier protein